MKRWEYWNIHLILAPVYLRMLGWCLRHRVTPLGLLKANYALDHGGATFASKYDIQMCFPQRHFPPTIFLKGSDSVETRTAQIDDFAARHGYPVILKPDLGRIGYGVTLLHTHTDAENFARAVDADYLVQSYVPGPLEFGVFYVRKGKAPQLMAINSKEFPSVRGDGRRTVGSLLEDHARLSAFAGLFNRQQFGRVPAAGEEVPLSVVGSHTLGCVFRDVTDLRTPAMLEATHAAVGIEGFNYGRLDVRTSSIEAFQRGDFTVIEVNGVESLATNAFDPSYSYGEGLRCFIEQYRLLVEIAAEHRQAEMEQISLREFVRRVSQAEDSINRLGSLLHRTPVLADSD